VLSQFVFEKILHLLERDCARVRLELHKGLGRLAPVRLDTNNALPEEALKLYRTSGWVEIDRFNEDPYPDHCFEKHL
jgi:hypothetical protein